MDDTVGAANTVAVHDALTRRPTVCRHNDAAGLTVAGDADYTRTVHQ